MSNSKWRKVFEELGALCEVTLMIRGQPHARTVMVAEVCETCLFAVNLPGARVDYRDILWLRMSCTPERAEQLNRLGKLDSRYENGVFTLAAY